MDILATENIVTFTTNQVITNDALQECLVNHYQEGESQLLRYHEVFRTNDLATYIVEYKKSSDQVFSVMEVAEVMGKVGCAVLSTLYSIECGPTEVTEQMRSLVRLCGIQFEKGRIVREREWQEGIDYSFWNPKQEILPVDLLEHLPETKN